MTTTAAHKWHNRSVSRTRQRADIAPNCRMVLSAVGETLGLMRGCYPTPAQWIATRLPLELHGVCNRTIDTLRGHASAWDDARRLLIIMHQVIPGRYNAKRPKRDCTPVYLRHVPVLRTWLAAIAGSIEPVVVRIDDQDASATGRVPVVAAWEGVCA